MNLNDRRPRDDVCDQILPNQLFYLTLQNLILLWAHMILSRVSQLVKVTVVKGSI